MGAGENAQRALAALRKQLAQHSTRDVASAYLHLCMRRANETEYQGELMSPARQGDVLLTLLLSTSEPITPAPYRQKEWQASAELLNDAFNAYLELFWPTPGEVSTLSDEWKRVRSVALPAFVHYFNTGLIANPGQVRDRIVAYLFPFDEEFAATGRLRPSDTIQVADWIAERLEHSLANLNAAMDELDAARELAITSADSVEMARVLVADKHPDLWPKVEAALDAFGSVRKADICAAFPAIGEAYWHGFSLGRGEAKAIDYPTERAEASTRPLVRVSADQAIIPSINSLWTALLESGENFLDGASIRVRYHRHRDLTFEQEVVRQFRRLVGSSASYYERAFDTPNARGEHDLIVVAGSVVFIVEAKASPQPEPFRDPDKAFMRLRDAFSSSKGIQGGFEQAEAIRTRLDKGELVRLFDRRGNAIGTLDPALLTERYSVVVTHDDFGPLATDLALLLEKPRDIPYPWVLNSLDLCAIADAWEHLQWGLDALTQYLRDRLRLHGKAFASDELEVVGFQLTHGSLEPLIKANADRVQLLPSYSDFFDDLYRHQRYGAPAPVATHTSPALMDARESFRKGTPVMIDLAGKPLHPSGRSQPLVRTKGSDRNKPCHCGSGKKLKKCHGAS